MKEYHFPAWVKLSKHESRDTIVSVDLNNTEVERLRSVTMQEDHESFYMCDAVSDIYKRVHLFAAYQIQHNLHEEDEADDQNLRAMFKYPFYVEFPEDL